MGQVKGEVKVQTCGHCPCIDCAAFSDCDIRDKCSDCKPMVLLFCSERRDA